MADPIGPISDAYVDGIIKASNVYNPNLNLTQGVKLRELIKLLRDRMEQQVGNISDEQAAHFTDIEYAGLVELIGAEGLNPGCFYRIVDFQTVHNFPNLSPVVVNTGPVEPIIVLALSANSLAAQAWSQAYPQDLLIYTTDNTVIAGATKGCILQRHDTVQNVKVCNDFRNVKYRRFKLAPVAFNAANAYAQYATVQGADGGLYYVAKDGGFVAGSATTPSTTSDDWVQVFPNNNYHYTWSGAASVNIPVTSAQSPLFANPNFPINQSDYVDSPVFQNYGAGYQNIEINNGPGNLFNLVIFNDNQSVIAHDLKISPADYNLTTARQLFESTIVLTGAGCIDGMTLDDGLAFSFITASGIIQNWRAPFVVYAATINVTQLSECVFSTFYGVTRGSLREVNGYRLEYVVTPMSFWNIYFPASLGNLHFNTNAFARGWNVNHGLGSSQLNTGVVQSSSPVVVVDVAMSWRTFIGYPDKTSSAAHQPSTDLQSQITMAKTRHIVYAYEQPGFKSVVDITNGSAKTISWQTDLADINLSTPSGQDNSEKRLMTFFIRHGNDFQVQQKDLVSGTWVPNNSPTFTIDSVDGNGNVTSVTLTPKSGATESRFIIV